MAKKFENTQAGRVQNYIECFGSITRAEAMHELGVANLPAVISTLRQHGIGVDTEEIKAKNRWGEKITYAKYVFSKESES